MPFFASYARKLLEIAVGRSPTGERTIALCSSEPAVGESNTELKAKELTFGGYVRSAMAGGATWWNAATGAAPALITNAKTVTFAEWTSGADQKATWFAVIEGTEVVGYGKLEAVVTIGAGNKIASFAAGTLEVTQS